MVRDKNKRAGMGGSSGGVIGLLETISSDFARLLTETTTAEDQAATAHQAFLDESSTDLATKDAELKHKALLDSDKHNHKGYS